MKWHKTYERRLGLQTPDEVFRFFMDSLKPRIARPDYFVNWEKVLNKTAEVEMHLNSLNYILGKENMGAALAEVLRASPNTVTALPHIFASRESQFVLIPQNIESYLDLQPQGFSLEAVCNEDGVMRVVRFCEAIGLFAFLKESGIKNLSDFVFGVEVGLDTNGRKNRGGSQMEGIVEHYLARISRECGYKYSSQASASTLEAEFGKHLTVDRTSRRIDFAVDTHCGLFLIETNFYGAGGSKLKSTAHEYKLLHNLIREDGHHFIWITDGAGWHSTRFPLREAFDHIDYVINLEMIENGVLGDILTDLG